MIRPRTPPRSETDLEPDLPPPRFTLRSLGIVFVLLGAAFLLMKWVSPIASAGLLLLAISVFAHIAGNYIGTRLQRRRIAPTEPSSLSGEDPLTAEEFAPRMQLGETTRINRIGYGVTIGMAILGAITGVIAGSYWAPREIWFPAVFAVCLASGAALGGIGGFTIFHFAWQLFQSWRQAMRHSKSASKRR
ncbi:hypothetical protein M4951_07315 [Blastopirellula sp. J2-11]|uniref:hypothetical protein n=1 Tax=Blastopirellula sp. J2-11 TaxID=2943192 RepID=UPI0021C81658|nr:hypothetical protein [Blastopirellula sp. J2-11]UUO08119.1 hypothetical protein M4951_07315 [Blastopirellula sp. J2-11]